MNKYINSESEQFFAFNIWSIESARAVIDGCAEYGRNVLLQTSAKAYQNIDKRQLREFVSSYAYDKGIKAYIHLDHCKNLENIREAINSGWDSVMIDGSDKTLEQNIKITNEATEIAHANGVMLEAEIGQINGSGGIAAIEDVKTFINETDVDMLAVAIGTSHGLYEGAPKLSYGLLEKVIEYTSIPLVIHGGTGLSDDTFKKLLSYKQVKKINISTDVKMAYRTAILECVDANLFVQKGFDPIRITEAVQSNIQQMVMQKLKIMRQINEENISVKYGNEKYT